MQNIFKKILAAFAPRPKQEFPGIVAARVMAIEKHPNADRLRVVKLDAGEKGEIYPVVCGAFNFQENDLVALAMVGASISQNIHSSTHEPFIISKTKIRGLESQGMICAAFELGLAKDPGNGIMVLKRTIAPGTDFSPDQIDKI